MQQERNVAGTKLFNVVWHLQVGGFRVRHARNDSNLYTSARVHGGKRMHVEMVHIPSPSMFCVWGVVWMLQMWFDGIILRLTMWSQWICLRMVRCDISYSHLWVLHIMASIEGWMNNISSTNNPPTNYKVAFFSNEMCNTCYIRLSHKTLWHTCVKTPRTPPFPSWWFACATFHANTTTIRKNCVAATSLGKAMGIPRRRRRRRCSRRRQKRHMCRVSEKRWHSNYTIERVIVVGVSMLQSPIPSDALR